MKPKIKEIVVDAFAVLCISVGFSIHGLLSLCFLLVGIICGAFALYFTLLNYRVHGATQAQARNWGLLFFAVFAIGLGEYWREYKQPINALAPNSAPTVLVVSPQTPSSGQGFAVSPNLNSVILTFGSDSFDMLLPKCPPGEIAVWNPQIPFGGFMEFFEHMTLRWDGSHLFVNFEWNPIFGMPPLKLEKNNLAGLPRDWDCNHTDRAIEVVNDKQIPIVQIYFKDDAHLVFKGIFTTQKQILFASETNGVNLNNTTGTNDIAHILNQQYFDANLDELRLKPLFKYPSWKFMGQFSENLN